MSRNATLTRMARRWTAQEGSGDLPDELYEALADGRSSGYEKRIIKNLARRTRIIDPTSISIRPYSEFSKDWEYTGSIYGHTRKCELCGHEPIVENCVLKNEDNGDEMLIGNTCVIRYIEIRDESGRVLPDDEKREFLKGEMAEAKREFKRQEFAQAHPNAMLDLKRYETLMRAKKKYRGLARTVAKRIISHGYLGTKTRRAWDEFIQVAESELNAYHEWKKQEALRKAAAQTKDADRKAAFVQQLADARNQFHHEGLDWIDTAMQIENELNSWEKEMVGRTLEKIKVAGVASLSGGFERFRTEVITRVAMKNGDLPALPPIGVMLQELMNAGDNTLSEWEHGFCESVIARLAMGRSLSKAQQKIVDRLTPKEIKA